MNKHDRDIAFARAVAEIVVNDGIWRKSIADNLFINEQDWVDLAEQARVAIGEPAEAVDQPTLDAMRAGLRHLDRQLEAMQGDVDDAVQHTELGSLRRARLSGRMLGLAAARDLIDDAVESMRAGSR